MHHDTVAEVAKHFRAVREVGENTDALESVVGERLAGQAGAALGIEDGTGRAQTRTKNLSHPSRCFVARLGERPVVVVGSIVVDSSIPDQWRS